MFFVIIIIFFFVASYGKTQMNFLVNPIYSMGLFCVGQQEGSQNQGIAYQVRLSLGVK